jgi:hypothetical protein
MGVFWPRESRLGETYTAFVLSLEFGMENSDGTVPLLTRRNIYSYTLALGSPILT